MKNNKKIKIHVKNNHWAPGIFPTDAEGEKNFTITKSHFDKALEKFPEAKEKIESYSHRYQYLSYYNWDDKDKDKKVYKENSK